MRVTFLFLLTLLFCVIAVSASADIVFSETTSIGLRVVPVGERIDAARRILRLDPVAETITLPLCFPGGLGTVEFKNGAARIRLTEGSLDGWTVLTGETA